MRRPTRLAIDAANFVRDARGLGRIARPVVRAALLDDRFAVTLLARARADVRALRAEYPAATIGPPRAARRRGRFDVVWFPFNGMRFRVAAPAVVSIADAFAFAEPHPERVARFREQAPIRRAARYATRIVTISQWSRSEIARRLGIASERIEAIVPAPDPYWFPASDDALPAALADARFALLVGATEARKNVRLALDACARALVSPDEWLVVVGRLSDADRAFARARGVRAGEIAASDAMLRALYRNATVVLVPSLAEGFGLVAVEALACGAPVLAADAAALPEATGGAATLLDPHDPLAWAHAIRAAFDEAPAPDARAARLERFAAPDRDAPARRLLGLLDDVGRGVAAP